MGCKAAKKALQKKKASGSSISSLGEAEISAIEKLAEAQEAFAEAMKVHAEETKKKNQEENRRNSIEEKKSRWEHLAKMWDMYKSMGKDDQAAAIVQEMESLIASGSAVSSGA
jgi:hypothetical protein